MQDLALAEGALPRHLHMAMFTQSTDRRLLMNRSGRNMNKFVLLDITVQYMPTSIFALDLFRQLSRHLVGLWTTGHPTAMALLKRILVCVPDYF
jgi:DnaJ family protein C protein 13